jgi:hypothetical protein
MYGKLKELAETEPIFLIINLKLMLFCALARVLQK